MGLEPREPLPDSVTFSYHHVAYGTYDGMMLDTLKETLSLARVIACPFLMEEELPRECHLWELGLGASGFGVIRSVPRNELLHHSFPRFQWPAGILWSPPRKGEKDFGFIDLTEKSSQAAEQIPWSVSKCQSTKRGKALFFGAFQVERAQLL